MTLLPSPYCRLSLSPLLGGRLPFPPRAAWDRWQGCGGVCVCEQPGLPAEAAWGFLGWPHAPSSLGLKEGGAGQEASRGLRQPTCSPLVVRALPGLPVSRVWLRSSLSSCLRSAAGPSVTWVPALTCPFVFVDTGLLLVCFLTTVHQTDCCSQQMPKHPHLLFLCPSPLALLSLRPPYLVQV